MKPGIHLVHKPAGPTSFSIVRDFIERAKRDHPSKPPRLCHGGTLDPFAQGLLLILVQPATRLFDHLHDVPKVYEAGVRWGVETDNGDPLGETTFIGDATGLNQARVDAAVQPFLGWTEQIPPVTSAKRIGGQRAYELAHRGEVVTLPPSRVYMHDARWVDHDLPHQSTLRLTVRGGFYVRSLIRDLGRQLGCGAHTSRLRRVSIGPWVDPAAGTIETVTGIDVLPWVPQRIMNDQEVGILRKEGLIDMGTLQPPEWPLPAGFPAGPPVVRGVHLGRLAFLLMPDNGRLKLHAALPGL